MSDNVRTCTTCRYFNGLNGRDLCTWHSSTDPVRGRVVKPRPALYERSRWVLVPGGERCKPEGRHWEARPVSAPPAPAS